MTFSYYKVLIYLNIKYFSSDVYRKGRTGQCLKDSVTVEGGRWQSELGAGAVG